MSFDNQLFYWRGGFFYYKFVAHKAGKFQFQGRLALPILELAYLFLGIAHALRAIVVAKMLPEVRKVLQKLDEHGMRGPGPAQYKNSLALLEGVYCRHIG